MSSPTIERGGVLPTALAETADTGVDVSRPAQLARLQGQARQRAAVKPDRLSELMERYASGDEAVFLCPAQGGEPERQGRRGRPRHHLRCREAARPSRLRATEGGARCRGLERIWTLCNLARRRKCSMHECVAPSRLRPRREHERTRCMLIAALVGSLAPCVREVGTRPVVQYNDVLHGWARTTC